MLRLFGKREVDLVAGFVERFGPLDEELEGFPPGNIRAYRLQRASLFEVAPYAFGLLLEPFGQPLDLGVEFGVGRLDLLPG